MIDGFPIPAIERLPTKITPCPIVEAILEIRFVTSESWRTLPGLLFARVRDRYPQQRELAAAQIPDEIRRQDPALFHQPLLQFIGKDFLIQFGPRVVNLVTKLHSYPGWAALETEMSWLLKELEKIAFIGECERLGVRYVNFVSHNVFDDLILNLCVDDSPVTSGESSITTVLRKNPMAARLLVSNSVIFGDGAAAKKGSILDIDVWLGALDFDLFSNGLVRFEEAYRFEKEIFFGLLKPSTLASLNPEYS